MAMPHLRGLGLAALAGIMAAAGCTVVVDDPPPRPRPGPQVCTQEYAPVCARRGGDTRTFTNACYARANDYRILYRGECSRPGGPRPPAQPNPPPGSAPPGASNPPGTSGRPPQVCTQEYGPVCARRGNDTRTFSSSCDAQAASYRVLYRGPC